MWIRGAEASPTKVTVFTEHNGGNPERIVVKRGARDQTRSMKKKRSGRCRQFGNVMETFHPNGILVAGSTAAGPVMRSRVRLVVVNKGP